jgi:hypothetical protein
MRCIFDLFVAAKLVAVAGEPLVFILPATDTAKTTTKQHGKDKRNSRVLLENKNVDFGRQPHAKYDVDFGRQPHAKDNKNLGLLSEKTDSQKAAFQSARETGLLDFDNALEDIFTGNFHTKDMARRLGKQSKSKSSKHAWTDGKSAWNDGKSSKSQLSKSKSSESKSSQSNLSKSKSSKSKSSKSKSSKSKSSKSNAWNGYHAGAGGWGSASAKSAKAHGYESRSTSIDFSYQIGSYGLWTIDESPERVEPPAEIKADVTASPVSAKPAPAIVKPRQETLLVSELATLDSTNAMSTPDVSNSNGSTAGDENLRSNKMYYVAGATLFGGLLVFFASVLIKKKITKPGDTHTKLNESSSQDDTEVTTPSDGTQSYNVGAIGLPSQEEWSHPDSWLAFDMR